MINVELLLKFIYLNINFAFVKQETNSDAFLLQMSRERARQYLNQVSNVTGSDSTAHQQIVLLRSIHAEELSEKTQLIAQMTAIIRDLEQQNERLRGLRRGYYVNSLMGSHVANVVRVFCAYALKYTDQSLLPLVSLSTSKR